jgi:S-DNA-T family DNA segregation ATPase FtsK/SpoIIIE
MIIIGEPAEHYEATDRKEVIIECVRSDQYNLKVPIDTLPRLKNDDGDVVHLPNIGKAVSRALDDMIPVASFDPKLLNKICSIAATVGAKKVQLFQPRDSAQKIGFKFDFDPEIVANLFEQWEGKIPVTGMVVAEREESLEAVQPKSIPESKAKKKKPEAPEVSEPSAGTEDPPPAFAEVLLQYDPSMTPERDGYKFPALEILENSDFIHIEDGEHGERIRGALSGFGIAAMIDKVHVGPTISQYEVRIPKGVSAKKILNLQDDLQRELGVNSIRIEAPIPGKTTIGIEIPNSKAQTVSLRAVVGNKRFMENESRLMIGLGLDIAGNPVDADLAKMPHILIAGTTGSGKSVAVASILASLLLRNSPKDLRLMLIDPKRVELGLFKGIPHLLCPVITDVQDCAGALRQVVQEMEHRYSLMEKEGVRNIERWNAKADSTSKLAYWVVIVDEMADLMMQVGDQVEDLIVRLAQKARAVGIHLILATQRPTVNVCTGNIKANVPSRIGLNVASRTDSMVILDQNGAEKLIGQGDMLFLSGTAGGKTIRIQGAYLSEDEIAAVCKPWKDQGDPEYEFELNSSEFEDVDSILLGVVQWVKDLETVNAQQIVTKFEVRMPVAARIIDRLEKMNVIVRQKNGPCKVVKG